MPLRLTSDTTAQDVDAIRAGMRETEGGAFVDFATVEIAQADLLNQSGPGQFSRKIIKVNGSEVTSVNLIKPTDAVEVTWLLLPETLGWIAHTLQARSPILSGEYRDNHLLFADGVQVHPENAPLASEYVFVNPEPYARKIEIGTTESGRAFEVNVPNRIYQRTAADAAAKFSGARITFEFRSGSGLPQERGGARAVYPAIIVKPS